ncbi:LacI family DNA-binding transcriptional regulator [Deinococcus peraridilitoris]|uniref:Transcriptional regulator n=1 Tax=Deinococcus peraridilitoris (strain DSM 19664 / LMG 22246 / CIP 109416 / KR-200) TaxID=937777 RepID=L0A5R2_DEIPD|nr:LacI family DNA-binding transcriptional regulator [Deinococcus peraridilitoris]AFZ69218.1 transcriptional regulator [Deinococcus peraridilitoris DSM 19664]
MATINEVSRRAGVSVATVSRVLNNSGPVKPKTREKVLAVMRDLQYQPNTVAQALVSGRSSGIGVLVGDLGSPFFGQVLKGIENVVREGGMHVMVSSGDFDAQRERESVEFLRGRRVEALIVQVDASSNDTLLEWARHSAPMVVFGRHLPELTDRCVWLDNEQGGYLAARHLLRAGHRRIAHISGPLYHEDCRARLQGYGRALLEAGIDLNDDLVVESDFSEAGGQQAAEQLLKLGSAFTAVFVDNDQMAAGVLQACRTAGLQVPDDISVVGYDDVVFASYLTPALTTVRQPLIEMGEATARLALHLLGNGGGTVQRKFEPTLIPRQSVRTLS